LTAVKSVVLPAAFAGERLPAPGLAQSPTLLTTVKKRGFCRLRLWERLPAPGLI